MIATVAALTLSIRVLGGAIGYCIYYNVFKQKFVENATTLIGGTAFEMNITSTPAIVEIIGLTAAGLLDDIKLIPGVDTEAKYQALVLAGQVAYAKSYPYVYYVSLAFGGISIICSFFLGDIRKYMTDHTAVVYNKNALEHVHGHHHEEDVKI